jgi:hypothetical protein
MRLSFRFASICNGLHYDMLKLSERTVVDDLPIR